MKYANEDQIAAQIAQLKTLLATAAAMRSQSVAAEFSLQRDAIMRAVWHFDQRMRSGRTEGVYQPDAGLRQHIFDAIDAMAEAVRGSLEPRMTLRIVMSTYDKPHYYYRTVRGITPALIKYLKALDAAHRQEDETTSAVFTPHGSTTSVRLEGGGVPIYFVPDADGRHNPEGRLLPAHLVCNRGMGAHDMQYAERIQRTLMPFGAVLSAEAVLSDEQSIISLSGALRKLQAMTTIAA